MVLLQILAATVLSGPPAATDAAAPDPGPAPTAELSRPASTKEAELGAPRARRFMLGLEAVGLQVPALRTPIVDLDSRFIGETVAMGGLGAFGRYRIVPPIAFDLGVRSGSVRFRDDRDGFHTQVSHDLLIAEGGINLFVARGDVGHLEIDAGGGGMFQRIRYELGEDAELSSQTFGSGLVRVGVGAELLARRVAFVFSLRMYAVLTNRENATNSGPAFEGRPRSATLAAVPERQTFVVGSLGVAYRF